MYTERKQIFGLRKSKVAKSLQSAILGTAIAALSQTAYADETVPATNLTDPQDVAFDNTAKTTDGVTETSLEVVYEPTTEYKQALSDAKAAGVTIHENVEVIEKEASSIAEAEKLKEQLERDYAAKTEELKRAKTQLEQGNANNPDYAEYTRQQNEFKLKQKQYEDAIKNNSDEAERVRKHNEEVAKHNVEVAKANAEKLAQFERENAEYVKKAGKNYAYKYALAIENAIDDEKDTANIWNVDISGGTPLKTEDMSAGLDSAYYEKLDPAYWVGKEADNYTKAMLGKVEAYAVRLQVGQSITVRYSYKDGSNLHIDGDTVFENTNGIETPVKYVEYTYTMNESPSSTNEEIVYVTNDANIPFYRGMSDYSQDEDGKVKSGDLRLGGVRKYDTTIRGLGEDGRPLRLRYLITQADGTEKPLIEYLDVVNKNLFINSEKKTYVVVDKDNASDLTEEHGTKFTGNYEDITKVPNLDPNFRENKAWREVWSGMVDNKGTGIRFRTFDYQVPTIKDSQNTTPTTEESGTTETRYRAARFEVYTSTGEVVPESEYRLVTYADATGAPQEVKDLVLKDDSGRRLSDWGGYAIESVDPNHFYYKYAQNDKDLRIVWTLVPVDGVGEVRTVSQTWELSKYKGDLDPVATPTTITITPTYKDTVDWTFTDADGRVTKEELTESQYAAKVAAGETDAYLTVTKTEDGRSTTVRMHYTDYFNEMRSAKPTTHTVTEMVRPEYTTPFKMWGAAQMITRGTWWRSSSGIKMAGQADVGSISSARGSFEYDSGARPPKLKLGEPREPISYTPNEVTPPTPPTIKPPTTANTEVELLPRYVIKVQSSIEKKVKNTEGVDLHGKAIAKGSEVLWELKVDNLPAGRKETTKAVFEDVLPDGYELNLDDTRARNPLYDVSYDAQTRKLTFTAKATTLAEWNKKDPAAIANASNTYTLNVTPLVTEVTKDNVLFNKDVRLVSNVTDLFPYIDDDVYGASDKTDFYGILTHPLSSHINIDKILQDNPGFEFINKRVIGYLSGRRYDESDYNRFKKSPFYVIGHDNAFYIPIMSKPNVVNYGGYAENGVPLEALSNAEIKLIKAKDYYLDPNNRNFVEGVDDSGYVISRESRNKLKYTPFSYFLRPTFSDLVNDIKNGRKEVDAVFVGYSGLFRRITDGISYFDNDNNKYVVTTTGFVSDDFNLSAKTTLRNLVDSIRKNPKNSVIDSYYSAEFPHDSSNTADELVAFDSYLGRDDINDKSIVTKFFKPLIDKGIKVILDDSRPTATKEAVVEGGILFTKIPLTEREFFDNPVVKEYLKTGTSRTYKAQSPFLFKFDLPADAVLSNVSLEFDKEADFEAVKNHYKLDSKDFLKNLRIIDVNLDNDEFNTGEENPVLKNHPYKDDYLVSLAKKEELKLNSPYILRNINTKSGRREYRLFIGTPYTSTIGLLENTIGNLRLSYNVNNAKTGDIIKIKGIQKTPYYYEKGVDTEFHEVATRTDTYVPPTSGIAEAEVTAPVISGRVVNDKGLYRNNFVFKVNDGNPDLGGSIATSNIVEVKTREVNPVKQNLDSEGNDINNLGRTIGSTNYYTLKWDLDQYKDIVATESTINKGFYYFDDFPEEAVIPQNNLITYKLEDGSPVTGISTAVYTSLDAAPQEIKDVVAKANLTFKGAFQVFKADNAKAFFDAYVKTGKNIKIVTPMTVRGDFTSTGFYKNNAFQVDFGNGYYTNEVQNYVVNKPKPRKSNYNAEGVNINGKTMVAGSENHYTLLWDLDDYKDIQSSPEDIGKGFFMVDDYPEDILDIVPNRVEITELSGKAVTGITATVYNSLSEAPENVRNAFATTNYAPNGRIQVFSADNPQDFYEKYVKTGKSLNVVTVMRIKDEIAGRKTTYENTAYQLGYGTAMVTETTINHTPEDPNPTKKVENKAGVDINGKPVLKGSTLVYKLGWDLSNYAGIGAVTEEVDLGFYFIDDFPEDELTPQDGWSIVDASGNKVADMRSVVYNSVSVAPAGIRTILEKNRSNITGKFQVFYPNSNIDFFNKYVLKGAKLTIINPMTVTTTEEKTFENRAFQSEFGMLRNTTPVENRTEEPNPVKEVQNVDGVNINDTVVPVGSTNVYVLTWDLDQYRGIEADEDFVAKGFMYVDDFPEEVLVENDAKVQFKLVDGTPVTGLVARTYDSIDAVPENLRQMMIDGAITPKGKFQLYIPEDNEAFYNAYVKTGKTIKIYTPMKVKPVADGTEFKNNGFQIDFGSTFATGEVTNIVRIPEPHKQDLDEKGRDINDEVVPLGTTNYYTLAWDLDQYRGNKSAEEDIIKGFYMVDDFPEEAVDTHDGRVTVTTMDGAPVTGVTVKTYNLLTEVPENVRKALADAGIVIKGKFQLLSADNPLDFHAKYVTTGINLKVVTPMTLKNGFFGEYENTAYQIDFGAATATETVRNTVVTSEPEKKNENGEGVVINGKLMHPNFVNYYKLKWDLDQYVGANLAERHLQKGFYFVDDFPEDVVDVLTEKVTLLDANGNAVTGVTHTIVNSVEELPQAVKDAMATKNVAFKGKVQLFTADNPADFYERYVKKGLNIFITSPMVVKQDVSGNTVYRNRGYQIELGFISATEEIENIVPEVDPNKKDLNKDGVDINNSPTTLGFVNYYTLHWDLDQFKDIKATSEDNANGFFMVDDYPEDIVNPLNALAKVVEYDGTAVTGVSVNVYNSLAEAPENVRKAFAKSTFKPVGKIQVFSADNAQEFFEKYVKTGKNLKVIAPMQVREDLENREHVYRNTAYQINYGKAYTTETVVNNVPPVDPAKRNTNKDGVDINGRPMVRGMINDYKLTWDLDQYSGIKADNELISKGFYFVDDYPEEVLDIVGAPTLVTTDGVTVEGVTATVYASQDELPESVKKLLTRRGKTFNGKVQVFATTNPADFYNKYVKVGKVITITTPMVVKEEAVDGEYLNKAYQIGFDTLYETEEVPNTVVTPEPHKEDLNKDGVNINGLQMYVGGVNYYTLSWDLDQYKDIIPTNEEIAKGFHFIDDYPEEAVSILSNEVKVLTAKGQDITSEIAVHTYDTIDAVPENLRVVLVARGFKPKGSFQVLSAKNAVDFYNKYVKTGINLKVVDPMVVKDEMYGTNKKYINTSYQSEFGLLAQTETVENYVPGVDPEKKDLNLERIDINGRPMAVGMTNLFTLKWDLDQFKGMKAANEDVAKGFYFVDDYPEEAVEIVLKDVKLTDSTGKAVTGVTVNVYNSVDEAPTRVRELLAKQGFAPKGAIQVFSADNPVDFYEKYVQKGLSIMIDNPMVVKESAVGKSYKNTGIQIEFNHISVTDVVGNHVPEVEPKKHDLDEDSQDINNTVRTVGSTNYYTLDWDLDQFKDIIATSDDIAKGFFMVDDYPEDKVDIQSSLTKVTLLDGTVIDDVSIARYDSISDAPEGVRDAFAKKNIVVNGAIQVFVAKDPVDFYNKYVKTGINLKVVTPMKVKEEIQRANFTYENTAYQIDFGNPHVTATVVNEVVFPEPEKDNYNKDSVLINGTPTVRGMVNEYKLTWDLDQYRGIVASKSDLANGFYFVDDYPEEVVSVDSSAVRFVDTNGKAVEGISILNVDSMSQLPANLAKVFGKYGYRPKGAFQVFMANDPEVFYNKYVKAGLNITIIDPMMVHKTLPNEDTSYVNRGVQIGFNTLYDTKPVKNEVPPVDPHKKNLNKDSIDINKTPMYVGATNYYTLDWDLDQYKGIKADEELIAKGFFYVDDYPEEAVTINAKEVRLVTADGVDVTEHFVIEQFDHIEYASDLVKDAFKNANFKPKGSVQIISAKNAKQFYEEYVVKGVSLKIIDPMVVNSSMKDSDKNYYNTAYQIDFGTAYVTETVENHVPKVDPKKKDLNEDGVDINNKVVTVGTVHNYTLTWDLDQYKGIVASEEDVAKGFYFIDDYPEEAVEILKDNIKLIDSDGNRVDGVTVRTYDSVIEAPEAVRKAVEKAKATIKGRFQVFSADNPTDFYKRYVQTGKTITIVDPMRVKVEMKDSGAKYQNQGFQVEFGNLQATEIVTNEVPVVKPKKENLNRDNVDINGKPMAIGQVNNYTMTWKLDQYKGMLPTAEQIAKGFMYIDDYPEEAVTILSDEVVVKTPSGDVVDGLTVKVYASIDELTAELKTEFAKQGLVPKGSFQVISADNPVAFYDKYVKTGLNLTIVDPMMVRDELRGKETRYQNTAYQWDMGVISQTETVENYVPKVDPEKQNLDEARVNINGKEMLAESVNWYLHTWDLDQYKGMLADKDAILKGMFFVDDYPEDVVDILEDKIRIFYEIVEDVVLSDNQVADAVSNFRNKLAIEIGKKINQLATLSEDDPMVGAVKSEIESLRQKASLPVSEIENLVRHQKIVKEVPVSGINVVKYADLSSAPEAVQKALREAGYVVKGAIQVFMPEDPQAFFDNYVSKGISIKILDPMRVKAEMANIGGRYENSAFQIDFGKAHATEIVYNNIPKLENFKEVKVGDKDVNNGEIGINETFTYVLNGVEIPGNRADKLWEYVFVDDYQETHDEYSGVYEVIATVDFELQVRDENGEVVKVISIRKGDNLNKYVVHKHDSNNGVITLEMTDEFYAMLDNSQPFAAKAVLTMKRVAYGDVENTFHNRVNGVVVNSNTVKTHTPPPPTTPDKPRLPKTGDVSPVSATAFGLANLIAGFGLLRLGKSKRKK